MRWRGWRGSRGNVHDGLVPAMECATLPRNTEQSMTKRLLEQPACSIRRASTLGIWHLAFAHQLTQTAGHASAEHGLQVVG